MSTTDGTREEEAWTLGPARAEREATMLAEIGRLLTGPDDPLAAREAAARATLPLLGDVCVLDLLEDDGRLRREVVVHVDADHEEIARALGPARPWSPVYDALTREAPTVLSTTPAEFAAHGPPAAAEVRRRHALRHSVLVPLRTHGTAVGVLTFGSHDVAREYDAGAQRIAAVVAQRFALHVHATRALEEAREARARSDDARAVLEAVYAGSPVGLVHVDAHLRVERLNAALQPFAPPARAALHRPVDEVFATAEPPLSQVIAAATRDGGHATQVPVDIRAPDGRLHHFVVSCATIEGPADRPRGFSLTATDVTERELDDRARRRTVRHLAALAAVGELVDAQLEVEPTLHGIVRVSVEQLADLCVVTMPDADGAPRMVAVAHADPAREDLVRQLADDYPPDPDADAGAPAVLRTGVPELHDAIDDGLLARSARDPQHLELLRSLGMRSALIVPLAARGRRVGALTLVATDRSDRRFDWDDVRVAEEIGRRSALAIDAARLHRATDEARAHAEATLALERRTHQALQAALNRARILSEVSGVLERSLAPGALDRVGRLIARWLADDVEILVDTPALGRRHSRSTSARARAPEARVGHDRTFPLERRGRSLGSLTCRWWSAPGDPEDAELLQEIAERLTVTADAADLYAERAAAAETLQASLLPAILPVVPGAVLAARYRPAGRGGEIGGDFYDVFPLGDGTWMCVVGDVCGKGVAAATMTAEARYTLRALAPVARSPAAALRDLNEALLRHGSEERFVTLTAARLHPAEPDRTARVDVACAGHPAPVLLRGDGAHEQVDVCGQLAGMLPDIAVHETTVVLRPGDVLVAFTDGVTEADPGRVLDGRAIARRIGDRVDEGPSSVVLALERLALGRAPGGELRDDLAVVALALDP